MIEAREQCVWSDRPSSSVLFGLFVVSVLGALLLMILAEDSVPILLLFLPAIFILWQMIAMQHTHYELTTERLITHAGIFSRTIDEMELYRIKDFRIEQPIHLRMLGLANVVLLTSDITSPKLVIYAISDARKVVNKIRELVEYRRDIKGVRAFDVN